MARSMGVGETRMAARTVPRMMERSPVIADSRMVAQNAASTLSASLANGLKSKSAFIELLRRGADEPGWAHRRGDASATAFRGRRGGVEVEAGLTEPLVPEL